MEEQSCREKRACAAYSELQRLGAAANGPSAVQRSSAASAESVGLEKLIYKPFASNHLKLLPWIKPLRPDRVCCKMVTLQEGRHLGYIGGCDVRPRSRRTGKPAHGGDFRVKGEASGVKVTTSNR